MSTKLICDGCGRDMPPDQVELSGTRAEYHGGGGIPSGDFHLCVDCSVVAFHAMATRPLDVRVDMYKLATEIGVAQASRRLVPKPAMEPVTLPWEGHSIYGTPTRVRLGEDPGEVLVEYNRSSDVILAPDTADAMAAALTTAAAKARQS